MLDKEFHIRFTLADIGKLLCFSPVLVALVYALICLPWDSIDTPAWVQAVGSVGAIGMAIVISRQELLRAAEERKAEAERLRDERLYDSYQYLDKAFRVAVYAVETVKGAAGYILAGHITPQMLDYHCSLLEVSASDLDEIEFTRMESRVAGDAFMAIKRAVTLTRSTIQMKRAETATDFDPLKVLQWRQNVDQEINVMEKGIHGFLTRYPQVLDRIKFPLI